MIVSVIAYAIWILMVNDILSLSHLHRWFLSGHCSCSGCPMADPARHQAGLKEAQLRLWQKQRPPSTDLLLESIQVGPEAAGLIFKLEGAVRGEQSAQSMRIDDRYFDIID